MTLAAFLALPSVGTEPAPAPAPLPRKRPARTPRQVEIAEARAELASILEAHRHLLLATDAFPFVGEFDALSEVEVALTNSNHRLARLLRDEARRRR